MLPYLAKPGLCAFFVHRREGRLEFFLMDLCDCEEIVEVLDSSLSRIKWHLRPSTKRRLETDILALCTRLRPTVLVDYGGIMPKLQENLSSLLLLAQKTSHALQDLRVMVLDDMVYVVHIKELSEHVHSTLASEHLLSILDLEQNPPKMLQSTEKSEIASELFSIQKLFAIIFPVGDYTDLTSLSEHSALQPAEHIDLSGLVQDARITLPSLNGWLLGYPVTYLFSKAHAEKACKNLSTRSLCIYKIFISRKQKARSQLYETELMSFSVPRDLSQRLDKEPWIELFLTRLMEKVERCKHIWTSMRLETQVKESHQQSVVL